MVTREASFLQPVFRWSGGRVNYDPDAYEMNGFDVFVAYRQLVMHSDMTFPYGKEELRNYWLSDMNEPQRVRWDKAAEYLNRVQSKKDKAFHKARRQAIAKEKFGKKIEAVQRQQRIGKTALVLDEFNPSKEIATSLESA